MLQVGRWGKILAAVESGQSFMDMFCASAVAEYSARGGEIFCGKGCSSCCTLVVNCSAAEALRIAHLLDTRQEERVRGFVQRLKGLAAAAVDLPDYLRLYRKESGGCPFLDDGICGVYSARPISCRALLATRESRWCAVDFREVPAAEKLAFVESLDRKAAAFPMHYLASTRDAGQKLEAQVSQQMGEEFGFSIYGSMPVLVYLCRECRQAGSAVDDAEALLAAAAAAGLDSPFLLQVETL